MDNRNRLMGWFSALFMLLPAGACLGAGSACAGSPPGAQVPVPKAVQFLIALNAGPHWNGPEKKALREISNAHPVILTHQTKDMPAAVGVAADEIDRFLVIALPGNKNVLVLTSKADLPRRKIIAALAPAAKETKVAGKDVFVSEKAMQALWFVGKKALVLGKPADIAEYLKSAAGAPPLSARLEGMKAKTILLVSADVRSLGPMLQPGANPQANPLAPLLQAKRFRLSIEVAKGLRLKLRAVFADPKKAKDAEPALKAALQTINQYLGKAAAMMPKFLDSQQKDFPKATQLKPRLTKAMTSGREALKNVSFRIAGSTLEADCTIATDEPAATALLLATLLPRQRKK